MLALTRKCFKKALGGADSWLLKAIKRACIEARTLQNIINRKTYFILKKVIKEIFSHDVLLAFPNHKRGLS